MTSVFVINRVYCVLRKFKNLTSDVMNTEGFGYVNLKESNRNSCSHATQHSSMIQNKARIFQLYFGYVSFDIYQDTVDSRYLEIEGTLRNSSRYPYFDISDL